MLRYFSPGLIGSFLCATAACTGAPTPVAPDEIGPWQIAHTAAAAQETRLAADPADGAVSRTLELDAIRSNECTGEDVQLTGRIHLVSHMQSDGSLVGHFNYQQVTGTGLTSGLRYHSSTVDHLRLKAPFPSSIHSVRHFRLIAKGSAENLLVRALFHITVSATGNVTASIDELSMDCR